MYLADIIRQTPNLIEKTWSSLHHRMEKCIEVNGGHIEQLLQIKIDFKNKEYLIMIILQYKTMC